VEVIHQDVDAAARSYGAGRVESYKMDKNGQLENLKRSRGKYGRISGPFA